MQFLALSSPYSHSAIFWDTILIFTFSVRMVVFMGMECSGLRLVLRQSNWRRFSGTMFSSLLSKGKITQDLINPASAAGENLARDIIRASFSQDRMTYFPEDSKVVYRSKDGKVDLHIFKSWQYQWRRHENLPPILRTLSVPLMGANRESCNG